MAYLRLMAGAFTGIGALLLIWKGIESGDAGIIASGTGFLGTMVGFFVGEVNGKRSQ